MFPCKFARFIKDHVQKAKSSFQRIQIFCYTNINMGLFNVVLNGKLDTQ